MDNITFQMFWSQFKLLEKRMIELSDYVTIHPKNYAAFSNQFISMYLTVCSEIDSLADEYCKGFGADERERYGINNKMSLLLEHYPRLRHWRCRTRFPYEPINIVPFAKFTDTGAADWWKAYNLIKHKRTEKDDAGVYNFEKANLKNILFALAAFFILLTKAKEVYCAALPIEVDSALFTVELMN